MIQARVKVRERPKVETHSITMYPDEWHEITEDAWTRRIPISENLRRIVRAHYDMDAHDETEEALAS